MWHSWQRKRYELTVEKRGGILERTRRRWEGNILSWSWKNSIGGHETNSLAQNKEKRLAVLNAVIHLGFH
jgi:hypothetical protein